MSSVLAGDGGERTDDPNPRQGPASGGTVGAYAVAVLATLGGLALTALSVRPLAGPLFIPQFAAVVGAALYGGLGPGLLTMALSGLGFYALFFAPGLQDFEAYRLGAFGLSSASFAWVAARMRHLKAGAEGARVRAEAALAKAEAAEAEARAIGAQQERLVAVVSHDLRNPLNAIAFTVEHLRLGASERQAVGLSRIETSTQRMQSMIRDLLDFAEARHRSGLPVQPRPARLGDICRAAIDEIRTARPNRSVLLGVTGDDSVTLDPARVEQVVSNLVTNAIIHGSEEAPVTVNVARDGAGVRVEVANQGAPIPQDVLPTLFEPFRPGDAAGSVGLGLFIVREIARAHGGSVTVRSGEQGTTFTVVFPSGPTEVGAA